MENNNVFIPYDERSQEPEGFTFEDFTTGNRYNGYLGSQWNLMEKNGAIYLPLAELRGEDFYDYKIVNTYERPLNKFHIGFYRTATKDAVLVIAEKDLFIDLFNDKDILSYGFSVRLVQDVK